ncbi:MAG: hypothetical protein GYA74_01165 [Acidobacteria bacterium]|jgi:RNA processing factor Prp31|nr:hypothetical protein [Acidobacteriota bacterium]HOU48745.1 hypothetical protein [Candidatus Aminicenantes bacterium]HQH46523.1 hypothetical protein [Candidatus Aminicenantes bacterium]
MNASDDRFPALIRNLDLLKEIETAAGRLYAGFAAAFPEDAPLWDVLRAEEEGHARRVDELKRLVEADRQAFHPDKFNPAALNTFLAGLRESLRKLEKGEIWRRQALAVAQDLENTLSERAFYRVVQSELPEFNKLVEDIDRETRAHQQRLLEFIRLHFPAS